VLAALAVAVLWPALSLQAEAEPVEAMTDRRGREALLAFKASGGAASDVPLASWRGGTDPCGGGAWTGVTCSGGATPAVTKLVLSEDKFRAVAGDVGALARRVGLTWLNLYGTAVVGDVGALAPLTQLTVLDLRNTEVNGDLKGLAPLAQLTWLGLDRTEVGGDVKGLAPLVQLTWLSLYGTKAGGQAAGLAPLVQLKALWLGGTAVAGCGAFCAEPPLSCWLDQPAGWTLGPGCSGPVGPFGTHCVC
jgi:hypothetical protein